MTALLSIFGECPWVASPLLAIRFGTVALRGVPLVPLLMTFTAFGLSYLLLGRLYATPAEWRSGTPSAASRPNARAPLSAA